MADFDTKIRLFKNLAIQSGIPENVVDNFIASKQAFGERSQEYGGSANLVGKPTELPEAGEEVTPGVSYAQSRLGKNELPNLCEGFSELATLGHRGVYGSAIQAWQAHRGKAKSGVSGLKPGDLVYFEANQSNNYSGHTGVYSGNGKFISATPNGVKEMSINDWQKNYGSGYLGYIPAKDFAD